MQGKRRWAEGKVCLLVADRATREAVSPPLQRAGLEVRAVAGEAAALHALGREPLLAALVARTVGPAALSAILARARQCHPEVPVVVLGDSLSAAPEIVEAMRQGAIDYLQPPFEVGAVLARLQPVAEGRADAGPPGGSSKAADFFGLVGTSAAMRRLFATIEKVSRYKTNVLLLGESGTGKELIARALHGGGPRRQQLFVPINCATLGRELLENELFGHERGAFTGANERKKGLFELADSGTLFLDEIGEMDPSTQAKLLRVLESKEFRRVGGTSKIKVDLGVIAATNRNLPDLIASGKFREDLYYRLKVVTLSVPPLRERKEDIPALIDSFIADFNRRNRGKIRGVSPPLFKRFMAHDWPGNVRELKNAIESAAVLAVDDTIDADPAELLAAGIVAGGRDEPELRLPLDCTLAEAERRIIVAQVGRAKTKEAAARALGMGLRTLYTKLRGYDAKP